MAEQYKIELGVKLRDGAIQNEINEAQRTLKPIELKVDAETKELTNTIREALNSLSKGTKNALTIDTSKIEASLDKLSSVVVDIKNSLNTLDGKGMNDLVSSINQMATALGKAENESDSLVKSLSALSKKDFSLNIGLDMGKKNNNMIAYGRSARKQVIPELEAQIKYLEDLFGGQQATMNKLASQGKNVGFDIFTDFSDFNSESAIKKMEAMEKYINSLKKLATIDNVNLDGFNEIHKDASALINDITGVENAVDKAGDIPEKLKNLFGGSIDGEVLSKQLDSIVADLNEIKTAIQGLSQNNAIDGLTQSFNKLSEILDKLMTNAKSVQDVLGGVGTSTNTGMSNQVRNAQETAQAFKEVAQEAKKISNINIDISDGNIDKLRNALKNLKVDDSSIENATKELNEMNIVAKSVSGTFKDGNLVKWDVKGVQTMTDGLQRAVTVTKTLGKEGWVSSEKFSQGFDKIAAEAQQIQSRLKDTGAKGFAQEMQVAKDRAKQFKNSTGELAAALKQLDTAMDAVKNASVYDADDISGAQRLVEANKEYAAALMNVNSQLSKLEYAQKQSNSSEALTTAKNNALLRLKSLFEGNSEAAKRFASDVERIQRELNECGNTAGIKNLNKQITNLGLQIRQAGVQTETFGSRIKKQFIQYSSYVSVASLFMYAEQGLRSMFEQVKLIDSAMTELKKVTNETAESYEKFLTNAASRAREIGTTIDGLVSSTADFARLGYGFKDAQGLAEVANIYAVVGDEIEGVEGATESLISTMAAFKGEANGLSKSDFALSIVDKMNEVSNNFAISSGGLGEALKRSASAMYSSNNSLDETIALITASNTVVQDADVVGNAYKTIALRIRGAKSELEEMGEDTSGMAESSAKLRDELLALSGVDILEADGKTFKSTYDILNEISMVYKDLSDLSQANILEKLAGKRQANILSAALENFDIARDALETSMNSSGSAMQEHEKWQKSLEANGLPRHLEISVIEYI